MVDLICSCGHLDKEHSLNSPWNGWCNFMETKKKQCDCIEFRLDNLLYLEQLERESYYGNR